MEVSGKTKALTRIYFITGSVHGIRSMMFSWLPTAHHQAHHRMSFSQNLEDVPCPFSGINEVMILRLKGAQQHQNTCSGNGTGVTFGWVSWRNKRRFS